MSPIGYPSGGRSSVLRWRNPLGGMPPEKSIRSTSASIYETNIFGGGAFTTTDTSAWQTVRTANIKIPPGNVAICFGAFAYFSHSVGPAGAGFRVLLAQTDALDAYYQLEGGGNPGGGAGSASGNLYVAAADSLLSVYLSLMYPLSGLPLVQPGTRQMLFQTANGTAGTLTCSVGRLWAYVIGLAA